MAVSNMPAQRKLRPILRSDDKSICGELPTLTRLLKVEEVVLEPEYQAPAGTPVAVHAVRGRFSGQAAANQERERERLDKGNCQD